MGFLKNPVRSVKHIVSDPGQSLKNAWNSGGREASIGFGLAGPIGAAAGLGLKTLGQMMKPKVSEPEIPSLETSPGVVLSADNTVLRRWQDSALPPGLNPAARAAAGVRLRNRGLLSLAQPQLSYWDRLMGMAQRNQQTAEQVPNESSAKGFLGGFLGGLGL